MQSFNFSTLLKAFFFLLCAQNLQAQCLSDETKVSLIVETDDYGYETYWSLVPGGNNCNAGVIASGGNTVQIGCFGGGQEVATSNFGYGDNTTINEGPWCLKTGLSYTLYHVDDYGDGGATITIMIEDHPVYKFKSTGEGGAFDFTVSLPLVYNAELHKIENYSFNDLKPTVVRGHIFNIGASVIDSIDLSYSINGGMAVTETFSGLNLEPFADADFSFSNLWTPADTGNYALKVWLGNINGNADLDTANDTLGKSIYFRALKPNLINHYLTDSVIIKEISSASDGLNKPRDLAFAPTARPELWVINKNTASTGGSTVTYFDAGLPTQDAQLKQDGNAWHFMSLPTGIAFSYNGNFATSPGVFDANHQGGSSYFTGPTLWSGDWSIYAEPSGGNGSHLDMLHQSPYSMGIEWEADNVFWVYDGHNKNIARYDFQEDHGPGNDDHSDGIVHRYTELQVKRIDDHIANHMALDHDSGMMYIVDNGNKRVLRLDIHSGQPGADLVPYAEPLHEYKAVTGTDWSVYISSMGQPSGIAVQGDYLLVSDYSTGDIIIYDKTGTQGVELGRVNTGAAGIMGIEIGPDGKIWYVNTTTEKVFRLDYKPLLSVAVNEPGKGPGFSVSPNPTSQFFNVNIRANNLSENCRMRVVNALGLVLRDEAVDGRTTMRIDLAGQPTGYYFVQISDENGSRTERVLLSRH